MNNQQLESIWADGVPEKINKEDLMTIIDLNQICIRFTVERLLVPRDYKIIGVIRNLILHFNDERNSKVP